MGLKKLNIFDELLKYAETDEQINNIKDSDGRALKGMLNSLRLISEKELGFFDKSSALTAIANMEKPIKPGDGKVTYIRAKDTYKVNRPDVWGDILDNYESGINDTSAFEKTTNALIDANRLYDIGRWLDNFDGKVINGKIYDLPNELVQTSSQGTIAEFLKYSASPEIRTMLDEYLSLTTANLGVSSAEATKMRNDSAKKIALKILEEFGESHTPLTEKEAEEKLKNYLPFA